MGNFSKIYENLKDKEVNEGVVDKIKEVGFSIKLSMYIAFIEKTLIAMFKNTVGDEKVHPAGIEIIKSEVAKLKSVKSEDEFKVMAATIPNTIASKLDKLK